MRFMRPARSSLGAAILGVCLLVVGPGAGGSASAYLSCLANVEIRLCIDLEEGGVITYLARTGDSESVVNDHDLGRQVNQSYYAGPTPYGQPQRVPGHPWNPNGAGDDYGNASRVVSFSNDGREIYVKSIPMQWALDDVPCECTFEHWITLNGNAVHVRNRLTTSRSDKTLYPAYGQELPAVYTTGRYFRLFAYSGSEPYTGGPLTEVPLPPWVGVPVGATEHWAALVDDGGYGLGVLNPDVTRVISAFFGEEPCDCGPKDNPTGYMSPVTEAIIDPEAVYEYRYDLVLGTLSQIREFAVSNRPPDRRPDWHFERDRQGWSYWNAVDLRYPPDGALHVSLEREDPYLIAPQQTWQARDVPRIYIRAALHGSNGRAQVFWEPAGADGFSERESLFFEMTPDGRFHTYAVDLAASPEYRGVITRFRLDPSDGGAPGASLDLDWVSWKTARHARTVSLRLTGRLVASGRVAVADAYGVCNPAPVRIERRVSGRWVRAAPAFTDFRGVYRVRLRDRPGTYRAVAREVVAENEICAAAVSPPRRR